MPTIPARRVFTEFAGAAVLISASVRGVLARCQSAYGRSGILPLAVWNHASGAQSRPAQQATARCARRTDWKAARGTFECTALPGDKPDLRAWQTLRF